MSESVLVYLKSFSDKYHIKMKSSVVTAAVDADSASLCILIWQMYIYC